MHIARYAHARGNRYGHVCACVHAVCNVHAVLWVCVHTYEQQTHTHTCACVQCVHICVYVLCAHTCPCMHCVHSPMGVYVNTRVHAHAVCTYVCVCLPLTCAHKTNRAVCTLNTRTYVHIRIHIQTHRTLCTLCVSVHTCKTYIPTVHTAYTCTRVHITHMSAHRPPWADRHITCHAQPCTYVHPAHICAHTYS